MVTVAREIYRDEPIPDEANVRLLYGLGPRDIRRLEEGRAIAKRSALKRHRLGDERPTYVYSESERAWVLVDIVRAR